jgi:hypothetical protein
MTGLVLIPTRFDLLAPLPGTTRAFSIETLLFPAVYLSIEVKLTETNYIFGISAFSSI